MEREDRLEATFAALQEAGQVSVAALAERFEVSEMTVRRDLDELERQGACRRVHGGAVMAASRSYEPPFAVRRDRAVEAKQRIGAAVADLLTEGETVLLDIGTTTLAVAEALRGRRNITVLTPSLRIASVLADEGDLRLICLGGMVRPGERSMVGGLAEEAIRSFFVDVCVLGIGGIDPQAGLTEFNLDDASIKKVALGQSRRIVVAADASKLGSVAFAAVAPASDVHVLVTDTAPDDPRVKALEKQGVDVHSVGRDAS